MKTETQQVREVKQTVRRLRYGVTSEQVEAITLIDDAGEILEELRACGAVRKEGNLWLSIISTVRVIAPMGLLLDTELFGGDEIVR